jgi:hypothetical protein
VIFAAIRSQIPSSECQKACHADEICVGVYNLMEGDFDSAGGFGEDLIQRETLVFHWRTATRACAPLCASLWLVLFHSRTSARCDAGLKPSHSPSASPASASKSAIFPMAPPRCITR